MPHPAHDADAGAMLDMSAPAVARSSTPNGHYDERLDRSGAILPEWNTFAEYAGDLTPDFFTLAARRIARQLHEDGVTYNVYARADAPARPWALDVLPMMIGAAEWTSIEHGLRQQARLMNALARDLYGDQHTIREGLIPSALVFNHPGFLRACHGITPSNGVFLHVMAIDLARGPSGDWRVAGVRAQAPSGLGYALQNRVTIARVFPEAMRALSARPVTPFFDALVDAVSSGAPGANGAPHIVLLTPGPYAETYFDHIYLARRLGWPLVEGADLTVRHDRVYLKTVSGLRQVHVIWRRQDDAYCDPLELRADSTLGVPGLVQAWRAGNVRIANALGMSVLESAALLPFLPAVAERLLGEHLEMTPPPTHWCGESGAINYTQTGLSSFVIKPALSSFSMEPVIGAELDAAAHETWIGRLKSTPERYVVQQRLPLSHVPVWRNGALESRAVMLRVFLVADGRGDYLVMPGGLSRVAGDDRSTVSNQRGGGSKDTWVLSAGPADPGAPLEPRAPRRAASHGAQTTPSRTAEHLFWLGRYAERSENAARLARAVLSRLSESGTLPNSLRAPLLRTCHGQGLLVTETAAADAHADSASRAAMPLGQILLKGLFDRNAQHGLGFSVAAAARVAGSVRDRLSSDNWRILDRLAQGLVPDSESTLDLGEALERIDEIIVSLVAVGGLEMAHMPRDDGWRFLSLGRHLERLAFVSATLDDVASERATSETALLEWLLDLSDSLITYRARYQRPPEWPAVVELLLFDGSNPRSVMFQVGKLAKHVRLMPDGGPLDVVPEIDALARMGRDDDTRQGNLFGGSMTLDSVPRVCQRLASRVSDALTLRYFSHVSDRTRSTTGR